MSHYKSNLRDLLFNLFEVNRIQDGVLGAAPYGDLDEETARSTLEELHKFVHAKLAPSYVPADQTPLTLDGEGNVGLPVELKESLQAWYDASWHRLEIPESNDGYAACPSIIWAGFELASGANAAAVFYMFGSFVSRVVDRIGSEGQRARFVKRMVDEAWGATMVLTEPDAGSDVGAGRTKATPLDDGTWSLSGVKRFITNGDYDLPPNILHLVLARPEGAPEGTKGLSLFLVPKFWIEEDGSVGERNGVYVSAVEHKMGIKGSATCELTLGDRGVCRGLLAGEVHDGIRQMFNVIEHARMSIGIKSLATLSTAYLNALQYAKERVQGADLLQIMDKSATRVQIIRHPDVRRMLLSMKSHAEGMRALALYTASIQDQIALCDDKDERRTLERLNDLLLPLVKGYNSDAAWEQLAMALQVFGGAGYCTDFPMEQYIRDQKIDTLYEGTTHIQSLDLAFRKIARDQGAALQHMLGQIQATLTDEVGGEALAEERAALGRALADVGGMFATMMAKMGESLYHVGLQGNRLLVALAQLTIGWRLVVHAAIALNGLEQANDIDRSFYQGKVASARWFCRNILPGLTLARKLVEKSELSIMDLDDAAF